jgi:hypothetical protein
MKTETKHQNKRKDFIVHMDFLDPVKVKRHARMVMLGYGLIGLGIFIATVILLYYAYGFGFGKNGQVVQSGLLFVSSSPNPADIYLNGELYKSRTNTRATLVEGTYNVELKRDGYRDWRRQIAIAGGTVVHYDYPMLIPNKLVGTPVKAFDTAPAIALQSPDRRWQVLGFGTISQFEVFDLKDPKAVTSEVITLPPGILTASKKPQHWQLVEWSNDNKHVLLRHYFGDSTEYIILDRSDPTKSINLTKTLDSNPTKIELLNKTYDKYLLYDAAAQTLSRASLENPTAEAYLDHVLAFKSYGTGTVLYVAAAGPDGNGNAKIKLRTGADTYVLRELPGGTTYMVDISMYDGRMYAAAGAVSDGKVYVFENPVDEIHDKTIRVAVPRRVLMVPNLSSLSFSANSRFILAQGGQHFALSDAEDDKEFNYAVTDPIDAPQTEAKWIDGHHILYVSGGKAILLDYDNTNRQELMTALPGLLPVFSSDYRYVYNFQADAVNPAHANLVSTPLRTPEDI